MNYFDSDPDDSSDSSDDSAAYIRDIEDKDE